MLLFSIIFLVIFVFALLAVGIGFIYLERKQKQQITDVLAPPVKPVNSNGPVLIRKVELNRGLQQYVAGSPALQRIELLLLQSGIGWNATSLLLFSVFGCIAGGVLGSFVRVLYLPVPSLLAAAAAGAFLPFAWAMRKRKKALAAFESQFPEGLDFLARSMRAGHGFSISLELLGADAPEPMATAMRRVSNELQLGSPLSAAFEKLADHIPLIDVRFFIATVLLQQETGGNLAEVLTKLGYIIRERFKLQGDVKAAAAHGKITAMVLLGLPLFVAAFLMVVSPEYLLVLTVVKEGRYMLCGAIVGQILGYFTIQKIIDIKV